jgi:hypothetical protein
MRFTLPVTAAAIAVATGTAAVPNATTATGEEFPDGCVSCHVVLDDGADKRIGVLLKSIGHIRLSDKIKAIPGDCTSCHEDAADESFAQIIHSKHWRKGTDNVFLGRFGGDCRHCHEMDASTGVTGLKQGAKNW